MGHDEQGLGRLGRTLAALIAVVAMCVSGGLVLIAVSSTSAAFNEGATVITPNPWLRNGPFEGWGTSLAWFANATGRYGEEGSIVNRDEVSPQAYRKALAYGRDLREQLYESLFGADGLDLNMTRYNIGGGNASDVAYGYPFMRQGGAVPGYWAPDPDGSKGLYADSRGRVATRQKDRKRLDAAYDPDAVESYVWGARSRGTAAAQAVQAQEWWLKHAVERGDVTHIEAFANSAPWFMTESGYVTGGFDSRADNLRDPEKFARYVAEVVRHLDGLRTANGRRVVIDTVDPFNESETANWDTSGTFAADGSLPAADRSLIDRYWRRYYAGESKAAGASKEITPYRTGVKKVQEGMHVDVGHQRQVIAALDEALHEKGLDNVRISATDATGAWDFVGSLSRYTSADKARVGQYNTHSYTGSAGQLAARLMAQGDGRTLSMSEVDGNWQSGGFDPYGFANALGFAGKINADITRLQSQDFTLWQAVEDLYNMSSSDRDLNGNPADPEGENLNWGTVFVDFDCVVAGPDGRLYSERAVHDNGGRTSGIRPCTVTANTKYLALRAYTTFVHEGDVVIANDDADNSLTAQSPDGHTLTVVHRNDSELPQTVAIDLSKFGRIDDDAHGSLYVTSAPGRPLLSGRGGAAAEATIARMNRYSNVPRGSVRINRRTMTARVTIPGKSIADIRISGVSGVSDRAVGVESGGTYRITDESGARSLAGADGSDGGADGGTAGAVGAVSLGEPGGAGQADLWRMVAVGVADTARPTLREYVIVNAAGEVLVASGAGSGGSGSGSGGSGGGGDSGDDSGGYRLSLRQETLAQARRDRAAIWIVNSEDGERWELANAAAHRYLDVDASDAPTFADDHASIVRFQRMG
ncbi:glycoside hydrolase [Bifidobacterium simiarum]|uniref:glycoside hydrolase n=1 Tax=Bifidobacterium simiarum TaxID=2045441 RepID=UPI001BDC12BE|nr:glycoside hydrolase [Bifidobacterium simiarum]MBT1166495.1 hypothetical protein [Bifidobacterium simiarum]